MSAIACDVTGVLHNLPINIRSIPSVDWMTKVLLSKTSVIYLSPKLVGNYLKKMLSASDTHST